MREVTKKRVEGKIIQLSLFTFIFLSKLELFLEAQSSKLRTPSAGVHTVAGLLTTNSMIHRSTELLMDNRAINNKPTSCILTITKGKFKCQ